MQYDPIPLRVTAYYADGSSCIVDDWTIDKDTSIPGSYLATISYQEARAIISLTVLSLLLRNVIYAVPYMKLQKIQWVVPFAQEPVGIEVYLTGGTNLVPIGTLPQIAVILIFRDDHREYVKKDLSLMILILINLGLRQLELHIRSFLPT